MTFKNLKDYLCWPWLVSVPLLLGAFICSVFFVGTDNILIAPAVLCLLALAGIAVYPNFTQGWAIPRTNTFLFVMLFWAWLVLSMLWSTTPYVSTLFTIIISILPGLFAVSVMAARGEPWVRVHTLAMWLTICGFAVWALIQFFFMFETMGPRIHHPFLDPNSMAGLLNLGVAPAIGLFMLARTRGYAVLAGIILTVLYAALVVTQSRAGFFTCAAASLVLIGVCVWRNPGGIPWARLLFMSVAAVAIPLLANKVGVLENLVRPTIQETFMETRSLEDRFYLWQSTWEMIKDHFWFGTGLASFYFYYPRYRLPLDRSDGFFAHMDPLQYWAEMGVMAPILFYGVLICVLLRTIRALQSAGPGDFTARVKVMAPFCGMLALTGHAHLNYHLYMPGMLLPLSVMLAFWYTATEQAIGDAGERFFWKPEKRKIRLAAAGVLALVALTVAIWLVRVTSATYLITQVQAAVSTGKADEAGRKLYLAGLVAPGSYSRYPEYEARIRVAVLWDHAKTMDKAEVRRIYDEAMMYLKEAERLNPAFTSIWDLRARMNYAVNGIIINDGQEIAIRELARVIEANPLSADARVALAQILQAQGELAKAIAVLEQGVTWPRPKGRPDVVFLVTLAQLKRQAGDQAAHDAYMKEAEARARSYGMATQPQPAAP